MWIVATFFRHQFWTLYTAANSHRQAERYADICRQSRGERVLVMRQEQWSQRTKHRLDSSEAA